MAHARDHTSLVTAAGSRCRVAIGKNDVDKIKGCRPSSALARWIEQNLTSETLLSSEELSLSAEIAKNGTLQACIADGQPENLVPMNEDELLAAITELEQSTEILQRQSQVLEAQRDLSQRQSHEAAQLHHDIQIFAAEITRRDEISSRRLKAGVLEAQEELEELFRSTRAEVDNISKRIPSMISELLNSDDRSFTSLSKLDMAEAATNEIPCISLEDIEHLNKILSQAVAEEVQTRLDRVYLETFQQSVENVKADYVEADEDASALEQDLKSFYSEILDVAGMYVRQKYTEPLIRAIQIADKHRMTLASIHAQRIASELSKMTADLEELSDRLQTFHSYRCVMLKIQYDYEASNAITKSAMSSPMRAKNQSQGQVGPAMEGFLRHFGLPVITPDKIYEFINEKVAKLNKSGQGSVENIKRDVKKAAETRRKVVGSLVEGIDRGGLDDFVKMRDLEAKIIDLRGKVEAVSVTDMSQDARKQRHLLRNGPETWLSSFRLVEEFEDTPREGHIKTATITLFRPASSYLRHNCLFTSSTNLRYFANKTFNMVEREGLKDVKPITYEIRPTKLIPNSTFPLLHYRDLVDVDQLSTSEAAKVFEGNGWETQWVVRYAPTQRSHYHSKTHETMVVLNGNARIRFGAADLTPDDDPNEDHEAGGIEVDAAPGDVFVIPAGVSHKTFNTSPQAEFQWLTGGDGHGTGDADLDKLKISGFVMLGAYPKGCEWDFCKGGEGKENVPIPERDPVLGKSSDGLLGIWK